MTEKQQQLLFDKGITNVPSDVLCSDNTLAESVGMVYDNGEHRVIQKPAAYLPNTIVDQYTAAELVIIHRFNDVLRHIIQVTSVSTGSTYTVGDMLCKIKDGSTETLVNLGINISEEVSGVRVALEVKAETIGNTLILSSSQGMNYLLWDYINNTYKNLGTKIPDIQMRFGLTNPEYLGIDPSTGEPYTNPSPEQRDDLDPNTFVKLPRIGGVVFEDYVYETISIDLYAVGNKWEADTDIGYEDAKTGLIGLVSQRLNWVRERKHFAFPFWARSAVRLYDGSHINISNPFLLLPTVLNNWHVFCCDYDNPYTPKAMCDWENHIDDWTGWDQTNYMPLCAKLTYYSVIPSGVNLSDWSDIISGVDIFVSDEVKNFEMEGTWKILNVDSKEVSSSSPDVTTSDTCMPKYGVKKKLQKVIRNNFGTWHTYYKPTLLSETEIAERLVKQSVFYQIIELDRDDVEACAGSTNVKDSTTKMDRYALKHLTTQPTLENDDYFSRSDMVPGIIKAYNSRLHMADVWRGFYSGFDHFSYTAYQNNPGRAYYFFVHIKSESGERIVRAAANSYEIYDVWFFYPDPRAYQVDIYSSPDNSSFYRHASFSLKEHPSLNGAYHFGHLPAANEALPAGTLVTGLPDTAADAELLEGQVLVSEVNNPWLFKAAGYVNVGMGRIIGLASQTVALGQEEHGIHPLIVFSERGISTLRLNNEGVYIRSDELSREVCSNQKSITETDGAVFFVSEKGLMVIVGNQVKCVSEQLSGLYDSWAAGQVETGFGNYSGFFSNCFIAYDYRDSLLWIFDGSTHTVTNGNESTNVFGLQHCLIYSIKSGTFTKMKPFNSIVTRVVNDYPDYILESGTNLYSLTGRKSVNADTNTYSAKMLTRPMKLENALALKSIMEIRNMGYFSDSQNFSIKLEIYASNNLKDWVQITSLRGIPWQYYRFLYTFTNLYATDSFAGSVLITQERRTNKLRFMPARYTHATIDDPAKARELNPQPPTPEPPSPEIDPGPTPVTPGEIDDPEADEPTEPTYTYHAYVDPLNIVIPSGSASITQTIKVRNTRQAQGESEKPCELYIKLFKRVGSTYWDIASTSQKESEWTFQIAVTEDTDGIIVCVNTETFTTPFEYVDRVEISINGSEPEPTPTPDTGISIQFQNTSNERIYITGHQYISVLTSDATDWAPIHINFKSGVQKDGVQLSGVTHGGAGYYIEPGGTATFASNLLDIFVNGMKEPVSKYYGGSIFRWSQAFPQYPDPVYWRVYSWTDAHDPAVIESEPGPNPEDFNFTNGGIVVFVLTGTDQVHEGTITPTANPVDITDPTS